MALFDDIIGLNFFLNIIIKIDKVLRSPNFVLGLLG